MFITATPWLFKTRSDMFSHTQLVLFWEANKEQEMIQRAAESEDQELSGRIAGKPPAPFVTFWGGNFYPAAL